MISDTYLEDKETSQSPTELYLMHCIMNWYYTIAEITILIQIAQLNKDTDEQTQSFPEETEKVWQNYTILDNIESMG